MSADYHMPAIGPAPSGTDAESHYQGVLSGLTLTVVENTTDEGIGARFSPGTDSNAELFAVNAAQATYVPAGTTHTIGLDATGGNVEVTAPVDAGALVLERFSGGFVSSLNQPGFPRYGYAVYTGLEEATVRTAFEPSVKRLPRGELEVKWTQGTSVGRARLETNYLDQFMQGQVYLVAPGGQSLGRPALIDPNDPSSEREFGFRLVSAQGGDGTYAELRPLPLFRAITVGNPAWYAGHPLVTQATSLQTGAEFHVRFELWDADSGSSNPSPKYVPLDSGVEVALMVEDLATDTGVATATTDADGTVQFTVADPAADLGNGPDVYFVARTAGRQQAGHTLPDEWSTEGWENRDGTPGLLAGYTGTQFGTLATPITYRIGVDYHFDLSFRNPNSNTNQTLPPGMTAEIHLEDDEVDHYETTASSSSFGGVLFNIDPGDTLSLRIPARIKNSSIKLDASVFWNDDLDNLVFPENITFNLEFTDPSEGKSRFRYDVGRQTFGTHTNPVAAEARDIGAVAVYFLKLAHELCTFFTLMTNGSWKGLEELTITPYAPANAFSWPEGYVWIDENSLSSRNTIIHELTHQILWRELEISEVIVESLAAGQMAENWLRQYVGVLNTDIGDALNWGDTIEWYNHILHSSDLLGNPYNSLIEGWPYFISGLYAATGGLPNPSIVGPNTRLRTIDELMGAPRQGAGTHRLGPVGSNLADDRGESVEGAFTNGMTRLLVEHVLGPISVSYPLIPEPTDHQITTTAPWVTNTSIQQRFQEIIWDSLIALRGRSPAMSQNATVLLDKTRQANSSRWHELAATLQGFNMANDSPTITGVDPPTAQHGVGGTQVTIIGDNFVADRTTVSFGSHVSPTVSVTSSTELTAEVPPQSAAGAVDLTAKVTSETPPGTPSSKAAVWDVGSTTISNGFTYL